jgi:hypothetical protein
LVLSVLEPFDAAAPQMAQQPCLGRLYVGSSGAVFNHCIFLPPKSPCAGKFPLLPGYLLIIDPREDFRSAVQTRAHYL